MKRFHVEIDGILIADGIDDAFRRIAEHFTALANHEEPSVFASPSSLSVEAMPEAKSCDDPDA